MSITIKIEDWKYESLEEMDTLLMYLIERRNNSVNAKGKSRMHVGFATGDEDPFVKVAHKGGGPEDECGCPECASLREETDEEFEECLKKAFAQEKNDARKKRAKKRAFEKSDTHWKCLEDAPPEYAAIDSRVVADSRGQIDTVTVTEEGMASERGYEVVLPEPIVKTQSSKRRARKSKVVQPPLVSEQIRVPVSIMTRNGLTDELAEYEHTVPGGSAFATAILAEPLPIDENPEEVFKRATAEAFESFCDKQTGVSAPQPKNTIPSPAAEQGEIPYSKLVDYIVALIHAGRTTQPEVMKCVEQMGLTQIIAFEKQPSLIRGFIKSLDALPGVSNGA